MRKTDIVERKEGILVSTQPQLGHHSRLLVKDGLDVNGSARARRALLATQRDPHKGRGYYHRVVKYRAKVGCREGSTTGRRAGRAGEAGGLGAWGY